MNKKTEILYQISLISCIVFYIVGACYFLYISAKSTGVTFAACIIAATFGMAQALRFGKMLLGYRTFTLPIRNNAYGLADISYDPKGQNYAYEIYLGEEKIICFSNNEYKGKKGSVALISRLCSDGYEIKHNTQVRIRVLVAKDAVN